MVGFLCGPTSKIWGVFPRELTWKTWKSPLRKGKSSSNPFIFRFPAVSFQWCVFLLILWEGTRQYFPGKPENSMGFLVPGPDPLEAYTLCLCAIFGSLRRCGRCIDTLWVPWLPNKAGFFFGELEGFQDIGWLSGFEMNSMIVRSPTQWSFGEILWYSCVLLFVDHLKQIKFEAF